MTDVKPDLTKPAFGDNAPKTEENKPEVTVESTEVKSTEEEDTKISEESRVPYSRFKKFHDRALEAEKEAAEWRAKAETIKTEKPPLTVDVPDFWLELYGDSEASQKAWQIQHKREQEIEQRAYEAGQRGAEELVQKQAQILNANLESLDEHLEDVVAVAGRELTDKEIETILDIIDEYTPKQENGNYVEGALLSADKAWEIYELKNQATRNPQNEVRNKIASLSSISSQGETTTNEKDKNWNPLETGSWRKRL